MWGNSEGRMAHLQRLGERHTRKCPPGLPGQRRLDQMQTALDVDPACSRGGENTHTHTYTQRKSEEKVRCNHIVPKLVSSEQERKEKGNKNQNKSRSSSSQKKIKPIPRAKAQLHGIPQWTRRFRQNHSGQCSPHLCQARWVAVAGSGTQPSRFLRLTCYQEQQPKESRCLQNNNQVAVYRLVGS